MTDPYRTASPPETRRRAPWLVALSIGWLVLVVVAVNALATWHGWARDNAWAPIAVIVDFVLVAALTAGAIFCVAAYVADGRKNDE